MDRPSWPPGVGQGQGQGHAASGSSRLLSTGMHDLYLIEACFFIWLARGLRVPGVLRVLRVLGVLGALLHKWVALVWHMATGTVQWPSLGIGIGN